MVEITYYCKDIKPKNPNSEMTLLQNINRLKPLIVKFPKVQNIKGHNDVSTKCQNVKITNGEMSKG